ncbi:MAG: peptidase U32 family protein [Planctomycetia bacterium]
MAEPVPVRRPEVLAPAGDEEALAAALAEGADAAYFGLSEGFNARARAGNFTLQALPATVARIHRAGARAYLTLNTLLFEGELALAERVVEAAARAGVDALIVQDPAVALLARELCPALEVHASTQMTISSPEAARFAQALGVTRVVVPRELSVEEVRRFAEGTPLELEVFIHGALCVSWSGQCLTSATWSGRSANRGECAQSCRLPYRLVVDGAPRDLGEVAYLLSPKDLAGVRAVEPLAALGVHSLKIEGRQKNATYVATATRLYRGLVDGLEAPGHEGRAREGLRDAALAYTRGFSDGFLGGSNHQDLVEGRFPKHRGVLLGRVASVLPGAVVVEPMPGGRPWTGALAAGGRTAPQGEPSAALSGYGGDAASGPQHAPLEPRAGMGVVFDAGRPEDQGEPGGPVFHVDALGGGRWRLGFGTPGPDLARVAAGQRVWVTSDPALQRSVAREAAGAEPEGRVPVRLAVTGALGRPLEAVLATCRPGRPVLQARAAGTSALAAATGRGLDEALLRDKLGALGGTPFRLEALDLAGLAPGLHVPVSELKALRRALVDDLRAQVERGPVREVRPGALARLVAARPARVPPPAAGSPPQLVVLCREDAQLEAVIEAGLPEVELDWMELVGLERAVARARAAGLRVTLATTRVQKPGEASWDARLARLAPDGVLLRHWGALVHFAQQAGHGPAPVLHGDFALNVTNSLTAALLLGQGLATFTPAHDLDALQLEALLAQVDPARATVVLHHRMPTFHTEHCVYAHLLSQGRDWRTCGRPCEQHRVSLQDTRGREHPVIVDVGCRNTVFHEQPTCAAGLVPGLLAQGVRRLRVELVREDRATTAALLAAYLGLLAGRLSPAEAAQQAGALAQVGVSARPMATLGA